MTTLAQAQLMLARYVAAEEAVLEGKEVRLSPPNGGFDRVWRSEDLAEIRAGRQEWERKVADMQAVASGAPTFGGVRFGVASFGPN
jgi:hypothetical protein